MAKCSVNVPRKRSFIFIFGLLTALAFGVVAHAANASWSVFRGREMRIVKGGAECSGGLLNYSEKSGKIELSLGPLIHFERDGNKAITTTSESVPAGCHYETEVTGNDTKFESKTVSSGCPDGASETVTETLEINKKGGIDYTADRHETGKPNQVTSCSYGSKK